jgi:6-phosphogluconolactonase
MEFIVRYDIKIFNSINDLSLYFANLLMNEVKEEDKFNLVLSGGRTPKDIFQYLSAHYKTKINWNKIKFFWGDERCVPPTDDRSNYKMAFDTLLSKLKIPDTNIFRIMGENDPVEEANRYSNVIKINVQIKNNVPRFDLIMLGLGEDGHTASIFPDQINLVDNNKICSVGIHPTSLQKRITLTGKVINHAKTIVFIATGESKTKIVSEVIDNKTNLKKYPASFINPNNGKLIWLLDQQSASLLKVN